MADEPQRFFNAMGIGIVVNEGEADVVMVTGTEDDPIHVVLTPDVAGQVGMSMFALSVEARILQEQIKDMSPEVLEHYLTEIQRRNARSTN